MEKTTVPGRFIIMIKGSRGLLHKLIDIKQQSLQRNRYWILRNGYPKGVNMLFFNKRLCFRDNHLQIRYKISNDFSLSSIATIKDMEKINSFIMIKGSRGLLHKLIDIKQQSLQRNRYWILRNGYPKGVNMLFFNKRLCFRDNHLQIRYKISNDCYLQSIATIKDYHLTQYQIAGTQNFRTKNYFNTHIPIL